MIKHPLCRHQAFLGCAGASCVPYSIFMSSPARRITMRDIAQRLGIDQSTVSLALRDHPRISEALRRKVRDAAGEMGYQPDAMLSALAHYRRANVEKPVT